MHPKEFRWYVASVLMLVYIGNYTRKKDYLQNAEVSLRVGSPIDQGGVSQNFKLWSLTCLTCSPGQFQFLPQLVHAGIPGVYHHVWLEFALKAQTYNYKVSHSILYVTDLNLNSFGFMNDERKKSLLALSSMDTTGFMVEGESSECSYRKIFISCEVALLFP